MKDLKWTDHGFKRTVASGILLVGLKRVLSQIILTSTNIFLARILAPEIFGSFAIISFLILTSGLLVNFGLAPALIQKRGVLTKDNLRAVFTILLMGSLIMVAGIFLFAPLINILYGGKLGEENIFWFRIFSFSLVLNHMTAISEILLERNLEYKKLTIGQLVTLFSAQIVTVTLALNGLGVGSFVLGTLIGGIVNFALFFNLSPWPIGIFFSLSKIKPFLSFGLNYQANTLVGAINGAVIPVFVGAVSGPRAVGLINWAAGLRGVGYAPFDVIENIIFPAASRVQDNKLLLKSLVEKMIRLSCLFSFPLLATIFALAPSITYIIYTGVWLQGLTALYIGTVQAIFIIIGAILIDVLLALGKAKTVRNISIFWAALQWILTVPLVLLWNFNGVVLAGMLVSATFFIPLYEVRKEVEIDLLPNVIPYLFLSIIGGLLMLLVSRLITISSVWELVLVAASGMGAYFGTLTLFEGRRLIADIIRFKELIFDAKT